MYYIFRFKNCGCAKGIFMKIGIFCDDMTCINIDSLDVIINASQYDVDALISIADESTFSTWAAKHKKPFSVVSIDWDNLNAPNANVKINKFGKKYNANAASYRNQIFSETCDKCIIITKIPNRDTKYITDIFSNRS